MNKNQLNFPNGFNKKVNQSLFWIEKNLPKKNLFYLQKTSFFDTTYSNNKVSSYKNSKIHAKFDSKNINENSVEMDDFNLKSKISSKRQFESLIQSLNQGFKPEANLSQRDKPKEGNEIKDFKEKWPILFNENKLEISDKEQKKESSFYTKKFSLKEKFNTNTVKSRFNDNSKQQVVSITYEEIGLFPRSFNRVFDRFFKQLFFDVESLVIQEYRFYRYLFLTTVKCVFILVFVPLSINFIAKNYFVRPITEYYWNSHQMEIFLNSYQQKRAFTELKNFEEKIYFESLIFPNPIGLSSCLSENTLNEGVDFSVEMADFNLKSKISSKSQSSLSNATLLQSSKVATLSEEKQKSKISSKRNEIEDFKEKLNKEWPKLMKFEKFEQISLSFCSNISNSFLSKSELNYGKNSVENSNKININDKEIVKENQKFSQLFTQSIQNRLQLQTVELAKHYNEESIEAITNFFADLISLSTLFVLLKLLEIQINITKSFLLEVFFGLDDSKKSLLILFITDLLVGYHSPNIWELFFSTIFDHYGLPESQTTIFLLVATLPVLLDVLFKYLIFRHLNRASPATVATYHAMIE
jgi:hypothetical protein